MSPEKSETQIREKELILKLHKGGKSYKQIGDLLFSEEICI